METYKTAFTFYLMFRNRGVYYHCRATVIQIHQLIKYSILGAIESLWIYKVDKSRLNCSGLVAGSWPASSGAAIMAE